MKRFQKLLCFGACTYEMAALTLYLEVKKKQLFV